MIRLRAPEPDDLDSLYRWENDTSCWQSTFSPVHVSRMRLWQYINEFDGDIDAWQQIRLMICAGDRGEAVGTIDLFDIDRRAGRAFVGVYIDDVMRRHGYARRALEQLVVYSRDYLNLHQLAAIVAVDNKASVSLFTSAGFKSAGRLRSWMRVSGHYVDALLFQRLFT